MVPLLGKFIRFRNASDYMWMGMIGIMVVRAEDMFSSPWEVMQWTGLNNEESPSEAR